MDDQPDEVTRFRKLLARRFVVGAGTSIDAALADLPPGQKRPDLFLLDLYYSQQSADATSEAALRDARVTFLRAETEFKKKLDELGQTSRGGFATQAELRRLYRPRHVPTAFFTRKGTLENAIEAYEGGTPVIKKPDPSTDRLAGAAGTTLGDLYDEAAEQQADRIAREVESVIRRSGLWYRYGEFIRVALVVGILVSFLGSLLAAWVTLGLGWK